MHRVVIDSYMGSLSKRTLEDRLTMPCIYEKEETGYVIEIHHNKSVRE